LESALSNKSEDTKVRAFAAETLHTGIGAGLMRCCCETCKTHHARFASGACSPWGKCGRRKHYLPLSVLRKATTASFTVGGQLARKRKTQLLRLNMGPAEAGDAAFFVLTVSSC
jgi:hypothetical protein